MTTTSSLFFVHAVSVVVAIVLGSALTAMSHLLKDWLSFTVGRESRRYARRMSDSELETRKTKRKEATDSTDAVQPHADDANRSGSTDKPAALMPLPNVVLRQAEYSLISKEAVCWRV